ncbi:MULTISPECIES: endonuclease VIII [Salinicola]|uniref:DNA-(apurinic or apyrimidinic site) lyase n=1 Tax=Salinicola socius TaxID=404433 RepID=A0A1Q8SVJ9_9GAMM|nr:MULTISPECIES: endonuclease VIII [Salinicola]OLO05468.1 endonuclease VIII [Salinicola socius]
MPEGPEIRRVADRVGRVLINAPLTQVWFAFPEIEAAAGRLSRSHVTQVDCWGKALLITFADGHVLYSHNQLYGVWRLHRRDQPPSTGRQLRARLTTADHAASLYSASDISLWTTETLAQQPFLARLGPDLLTHDVASEDIVARLTERRFASRGLGSLLLDQGFYAGIGNYLRSEILFFAGLGPRQRPKDLSGAQRKRLAHCILATIDQAYREAGVTNRPAWRQRLQQAGKRRSEWRFAVFNREHQPCHVCGSIILRESVASRRLYRCPSCQPE